MSTPSTFQISGDTRPRSPRPVVAVLGEPGSYETLLNALKAAGADAFATVTPDELREADGMIVAGHASSLEAYEGLKARDAERIIGRRVAGGRPVLAAGSALGFLVESINVTHPDLGEVQVQAMGEWPGETIELASRELAPGASTINPAPASALLQGLEGELLFKSEHGVFAWEFDQSIDYIAPPIVSWTQTDPPYIAAVENGPLTAVQFCPVASGDAGEEFLRRWVASLPVTGRLAASAAEEEEK